MKAKIDSALYLAKLKLLKEVANPDKEGRGKR